MHSRLLQHIIFFSLIALLALSSCTLRPKNVLSRNKMVDVLYDLHKTDGVVHVQAVSYVQDEELKKYYEATLLKHGITQAQFDSSLVWYTDNPKRFNKIYPLVIARIQADLDSYAWLDDINNDVLGIDVKSYLDSVLNAPFKGMEIDLLPSINTTITSDTNYFFIFLPDSIEPLSLAILSQMDTLYIGIDSLSIPTDSLVLTIDSIND